nr:Transposase InsD for insertion element IS2 [Escherichia coli]
MTFAQDCCDREIIDEQRAPEAMTKKRCRMSCWVRWKTLRKAVANSAGVRPVAGTGALYDSRRSRKAMA